MAALLSDAVWLAARRLARAAPAALGREAAFRGHGDSGEAGNRAVRRFLRVSVRAWAGGGHNAAVSGLGSAARPFAFACRSDISAGPAAAN